MLLGVHKELWRKKMSEVSDPGCVILDALSFTLFVN